MHYIFEGVVDYLYAQAMYHIWLFFFFFFFFFFLVGGYGESSFKFYLKLCNRKTIIIPDSTRIFPQTYVKALVKLQSKAVLSVYT